MYPRGDFERRNLNYNLRSLYYKRDTLPMSLRSVPDFIPRNYPQPVSVGSATFQRSITNGRSCSSMSVRSKDTNVSMSGKEIALAINNAAFNMNDIRLIKEAIDKLYKKRFRKGIEKRKNRKLLHMSKRKSGNDSGEEGSDSSVSNDDCRSIRIAPCVTIHKHKSKLNVSNFNMTDKDNYMYTNRTEDMKRKSLRNMISSDRPPKKIVNTNETRENNLSEEMESEKEEIFSEITTIEKNCRISRSNKRTIELDESNHSPHKKSKVQMPLRKSGNTKKKIQSPEKLISKLRERLSDITEASTAIISPRKGSITPDEIELIEKGNNDIASIKPGPSSDLSMQPSFIKRKQFTQKLDVVEKRNISDSSLSSTQVKNLSGIKEKTKARKLASSQSCLSRDVLGEDNNNFLDLHHKIVPAEQINVTYSTNKTACHRNSQRDSNDKWDITPVISSCLENDISDTYTDEEIFKVKNHCSNKPKETSDLSHKQLPETTTKDSNKIINKKVKSFWDTDTETELENNASSNNLNFSLTINDTVDERRNVAKCSKKVQDQNTECMSTETKATEVRNKPQKGTNKINVPRPETKKVTRNNKRKVSSGAKEKNDNLNTSCSSDKNKQKKDPAKTSKKVTLIGHRIGNHRRQLRSKRVNTIETPQKPSNISINGIEKPAESCKIGKPKRQIEPKTTNTEPPLKNSNISNKEKGTPKISKDTTINHKSGRSKRQVNSKKNCPVEFSSSQSAHNSASDLNISIKSLRSYKMKRK